MSEEQMNNPILQFDFLTDQTDSPLQFKDPLEIITTSNLNEVGACLDRVAQAVQDGYYTAGYLSYEASSAFYDHLKRDVDHKMPLIWFGVFKKPITEKWNETSAYTIGNWDMTQSKETYEKKFSQVIQAIRNGQTEQVNYTVPFEALFTGNSYAYYTELKKAQRANYSAYLDLGDFQILSVSPELFFQVENEQITVKPMKGTIHRGKTYEEDIKNKQWLETSRKNRRENKLITNLMKEELLHVADKMSITVEKECEVEQYPTVYQMTSTITGNVLPGQNIATIMQALFPCGSISGAPKLETLKLISELEEKPREVYCGAIGYMTPSGKAVFNVPIRTVMIDTQENKASYHAGGGITEFSNVQEEYTEVLTKTKVLHWKEAPFQLLESFGLYDGKFIAFDAHIRRLIHSATYFNFPICINRIKERLSEYQNKYKQGTWKVRLLVYEDGQEQIEIAPLSAIKNNQFTLAKKPIDKENKFLYHKTTNRACYDIHAVENMFDVLLWNEDNEITEFTIGNIVVEFAGELYTPPVESGLLPGTFREILLKENKIKERTLYTSDLVNCTTIWLINSVRQWVKMDYVP